MTKAPTRGRGPRSGSNNQQRAKAGGKGEARRKSAGKQGAPAGRTRASSVPEWARGAFATRGKRKGAATRGTAVSGQGEGGRSKSAGAAGRNESAGAAGRGKSAGTGGRGKSAGVGGRNKSAGVSGRNKSAGVSGRNKSAGVKSAGVGTRSKSAGTGNKSTGSVGRNKSAGAVGRNKSTGAVGRNKSTGAAGRNKSTGVRGLSKSAGPAVRSENAGAVAAERKRAGASRGTSPGQRPNLGEHRPGAARNATGERGAPWGAGERAGKRPGARAAGVGAKVEVFIESLAAGGDGVGRDDRGRVTFVPYTAPGDTVKAQVIEVHKDFARAEPIEIETSSAYRVDAPCPHFIARTCGGCQWQHLGEAVQAAAKDELCSRLLRKHVSAGLEIYSLRDEVEPYYWRRRARLHWYRPRKAEGAIIGFYGPRSHHVSDISACMQLEPALKQAVDVLRDRLAPALGRQGSIEAVAGHLGEVHVFIHGPADRDVAAALVGQGPIVGVMLGDDEGEPRPRDGAGREPARHRDADGSRRPHKHAVQSFGRPHIELEAGLPGRSDWFAQPSLAGNQMLLEVVDQASAPRDGMRVLELYAGSGNLSRVLAPGAVEFVAVDYRKPSWPLPEALDRSFVAGDVVEVTQRLAAEGRTFDLVVLDPPRTGAREVIASVVALAPWRIVYVSCDPATLARDLDGFAEAGYRARWAQPLDLMPQTAHVEIVTVLERAPAPAPAPPA
jgi:23S rRNA (uracil1939-C5)-methyltransferase